MFFIEVMEGKRAWEGEKFNGGQTPDEGSKGSVSSSHMLAFPVSPFPFRSGSVSSALMLIWKLNLF